MSALQAGSGQSEFLTVYGGLEFAIVGVFLWPLVQRDSTKFALLCCLWLHGCLVAFRSFGFLLYHDVPSTTYALAATEWAIFLASAGIARFSRESVER